MPDLIPAKDGIVDRHPEPKKSTGFRVKPGMTTGGLGNLPDTLTSPPLTACPPKQVTAKGGEGKKGRVINQDLDIIIFEGKPTRMYFCDKF